MLRIQEDPFHVSIVDGGGRRHVLEAPYSGFIALGRHRQGLEAVARTSIGIDLVSSRCY